MILNLPYRPHSEGNPSGLFHSNFYVYSSQKDIRITEWPLRWSSRSFDIPLGNCSFSPETLIQVACMIQVKYKYTLLDPWCFLAVIRDFINGTFLALTTEKSSFFYKVNTYRTKFGLNLQVVKYDENGHYNVHHDAQPVATHSHLKCCHLNVTKIPACRLCRLVKYFLEKRAHTAHVRAVAALERVWGEE